MKIFKLLAGWKTVIGYGLLLVPWITANPMLVGAIKAVSQDPSSQNIANLVAQLLLAIGIIDRIRKNLISPTLTT